MLNQEDQPSKHICLKLIKLLGICNVDYWTYTKTTPIHFIARETRAATHLNKVKTLGKWASVRLGAMSGGASSPGK